MGKEVTNFDEIIKEKELALKSTLKEKELALKEKESKQIKDYIKTEENSIEFKNIVRI